MSETIQHVFLVGAKSLGAYGGYETFIDKLTEYHQDDSRLKYHIACKANGDGYMDETKLNRINSIIKNNDGTTIEFTYHNARCFKLKIPPMGSAQAIYYDIYALSECCKYIKRNQIKHPIIYIMACRIGPFIKYFYNKIHKLDGIIYLNPDGHEWMRAKWNYWIRKYWKFSEFMMVKYSDLSICDSIAIEKYIHDNYDKKVEKKRTLKTTFIAYGAETQKSKLLNNNSELLNWYNSKGLSIKDYYLVVGRFVPENNFAIMIHEFMQSHSKKNLAIITTTNDKYLKKLEQKLHFNSDPRIKFVGTVYNQELLKKIRENAYGYLHGHEVGGTNPSLLEALGATDINLLLDVSFNREVGEDNALYWTKEPGNLAKLIEKVDRMKVDEIKMLGVKAKKRIVDKYSWEHIASQYKNLFLSSVPDC